MKVSAGDGLKRFQVSNGEEVVLANIRSYGDIGGEVELDWKWQEFKDSEQVGVGGKWDVHGECESQCFQIVQV
jgi:hypothetical protein